MEKIVGTIYLFMIAIGLICLFIPGSYWLISVLVFSIFIMIWIFQFTWRVATAVDNFIEKHQDPPATNIKIKPSSMDEYTDETLEDMK